MQTWNYALKYSQSNSYESTGNIFYLNHTEEDEVSDGTFYTMSDSLVPSSTWTQHDFFLEVLWCLP